MHIPNSAECADVAIANNAQVVLRLLQRHAVLS